MRGDASGSHFRRRKGTEPACRREAAGGRGALRREAPSGGRHAGRRFRFAFSQEEWERNPLAGAKRRRMRGHAQGGPFRRRHAGRRFRFGFRRRNGTKPLAARSGGRIAGALRRKAPSGGRHAGTTLPVRVFAGGMERNPLAGAKRREDVGPCAGRPLRRPPSWRGAPGSRFRRWNGTEPACRREAAGGLRGPARGRPLPRKAAAMRGQRSRFAFSQEEWNGTRLPARSGGGCGALRRKAPSGGRHAGRRLPVRVFAGGKERNPLAGGGCCQSSSKRGGRRSGVALHGKGRARSDRMETGRCLKPAIRPEIAGDRACGTEVGRISPRALSQSVGWKSAPRRKTDAAQAGGEGAVRFNRRSPPAWRRPTAGGAAAPGPRRN